MPTGGAEPLPYAPYVTCRTGRTESSAPTDGLLMVPPYITLFCRAGPVCPAVGAGEESSLGKAGFFRRGDPRGRPPHPSFPHIKTRRGKRPGGPACQKSLAEFAARRRQRNKIIFSRDMCVRENTTRAASVEFVRHRRTNYARSRPQAFCRKNPEGFSTVSTAGANAPAVLNAKIQFHRIPARKHPGSLASCARPQRSISSTLTQAVTTPSPQCSTVTDCKNASGQAVRT